MYLVEILTKMSSILKIDLEKKKNSLELQSWSWIRSESLSQGHRQRRDGANGHWDPRPGLNLCFLPHCQGDIDKFDKNKCMEENRRWWLMHQRGSWLVIILPVVKLLSFNSSPNDVCPPLWGLGWESADYMFSPLPAGFLLRDINRGQWRETGSQEEKSGLAPASLLLFLSMASNEHASLIVTAVFNLSFIPILAIAASPHPFRSLGGTHWLKNINPKPQNHAPGAKVQQHAEQL